MGEPKGKTARAREQVVILTPDAERRRTLCEAVRASALEPLVAGNVDSLRQMLDGPVVAVLFEPVAGDQALGALLDELREARNAVPVIAIESAATSADVARLFAAGVADVLSSAASDAEVRLAVERVCALASRVEWDKPVAPAAGGIYFGQYPSMLELEERLSRVAVSDATVLIRGESGTGKELLARALHRASARRDAPFVKVLCPGLPENLLESELFGYERGAFTGAASRKLGRVELAQGGTLFLDEIAEMSATMQSKLLRLLQDREYERLGGGRPLRADVRFVAATHRDLKSMIGAGEFREDLFHRLNVATLWVPPLRHRRNDIPALAQQFVRGFAARAGRALSLSGAALELMRKQSWPGNVRQLENFVERLVLFTDGSSLEATDVERELEEDERQFSTQQATASSRRVSAEGAGNVRANQGDSQVEPPGTLEEELWAVEHQLLLRAVARCKSKAEAASVLGISRATLYKKLSQHGLLDSATPKK